MTPLEKLIKHFEHFPGIGPRQARRFAFHLLTQPQEERAELAALIGAVTDTIVECPSCFRFFAKQGERTLCPLCANPLRDRTKLMIVERDSDIDAMERSRTYDGLYFVLGGTVPLLESIENTKLRGGALKTLVGTRVGEGLREIILAFAVNPDGENTERYVQVLIRDLIAGTPVSVSTLGRGLSTGSELEYADPETLKSALAGRQVRG